MTPFEAALAPKPVKTDVFSDRVAKEILARRESARLALFDRGVTPDSIAETIASCLNARKTISLGGGLTEEVPDYPTRLAAAKLGADLLSMTPGAIQLEIKTTQHVERVQGQQEEWAQIASKHARTMSNVAREIYGDASAEEIAAMDYEERGAYIQAVASARSIPGAPAPDPKDFIFVDMGGNLERPPLAHTVVTARVGL